MTGNLAAVAVPFVACAGPTDPSWWLALAEHLAAVAALVIYHEARGLYALRRTMSRLDKHVLLATKGTATDEVGHDSASDSGP